MRDNVDFSYSGTNEISEWINIEKQRQSPLRQIRSRSFEFHKARMFVSGWRSLGDDTSHHWDPHNDNRIER